MNKQAVNSKTKSPGKNNKPSQNRKIVISVLITAVLVITVVTAAILLNQPAAEKLSSSTTSESTQNASGDLVIPVSSISEKATFYPMTVDGTKLEVIAVKAPDGSIRTAFNTCQVCYASGRGYYKQDGDALVCQNCGNRFAMSDVEISKGGCNPVPIFDENKTVDDSNITISGDYLKEATQIFQNWKTA